MLKRLSLFFVYVIFSASAAVHGSVFCDQLSTLSPGIMQFLAHPQGKLIAAQEAASGSKTRLAFYEFQHGNDGGRKPQLTLFSALDQESAQGIVWSWTNKKQRLCIGTSMGRFAVYSVPSVEEDDDDADRTPVLLGEKTKPHTIKNICWSNEEDLFAIVLDKKLVLYAVDQESKKRPLRRITSADLPIDEITFLQWSHDDSTLVVGNSERLLFYKTRTPSGTLRLSAYTNLELDQALQSISGTIRDVSWNKKGVPTIAILNKKLTLISFQPAGSASPINTLHNFASNTGAALAWQVDDKPGASENQELIVASGTGRSYQVYLATTRSLMFDTTPHEFLQPYKLPQIAEPGQHKLVQKAASKHTLADETLIELINKLANR